MSQNEIFGKHVYKIPNNIKYQQSLLIIPIKENDVKTL